MKFAMTPACKEAIGALTAFVTILAVFVTAAVYGVDARVTMAVTPVAERLVRIEERITANQHTETLQRENVLRELDGVSGDLRWLIERELRPK